MAPPVGIAASALDLYAIVPASARGRIEAALGGGLMIVEHGYFCAIVRPTAETSLAGRGREELARLLLIHQRTVESVMALAPVLPVKFATVAPTWESVEHCLENGAPAFAAAFGRLTGKIQFEILVRWDLDQIFAELTGSPEVEKLKNELMASGQPDQQASIRFGAAVKALLDQRRAELTARLSTALQAVAQDTVDNALMDDRMVLNMAVLIDASETGQLDHCLETLDAAHDGALAFRCIGPLPPHSFATVEVSFLDAGKMDQARNMLGLTGEMDRDAVRAAYRFMAKRMHPDAVGEQGDGHTMNELHDAYAMLNTYAEAGGPARVMVCRQGMPSTAATGTE